VNEIPLPPGMAAKIAASEEAEERARVREESDRVSAAQDKARMAEVHGHQFESLTGYSPQVWEAARSALAQASCDSGFDPSAPVGSARHPEILVDGESLAQVARRAQAVDRDAELLARCDAGRRAWDHDPRILRQRAASRRAESRAAGSSPRPSGYGGGPYRTMSRSAAGELVLGPDYGEYAGVRIGGDPAALARLGDDLEARVAQRPVPVDPDMVESAGMVTALERAPFGGGPGTRRWS
jgi:hypothetical protein